MNHATTRAAILPEIIKLIQARFGLSEDEALHAFYTSATGASFADDDTASRRTISLGCSCRSRVTGNQDKRSCVDVGAWEWYNPNIQYQRHVKVCIVYSVSKCHLQKCRWHFFIFRPL